MLSGRNSKAMKKYGICFFLSGIFFYLLVMPELSGATSLSSIEVQESLNVYRVVLWMKGELPESVNIKSLPRITCQFSKLDVVPNIKIPRLPFGVVFDIRLNKGIKGSVELKISDPKAHVEYLVLPTIPAKPGMYRLIFDIIPSSKNQTLELAADSKKKEEQPSVIQEPTPSKPQEKPAEPLKHTSQTKIPFDEYIYLRAQEAFDSQHYKRAWILFSRYLARGNKSHRADALYKKALAFYKLHQGNTEKYGFDMIQLFQDALTESPNHKLAYEFKFLIAALYHKLGITKRAERLLEELLNKPIPEDVRLRALKEIGKIKLEKGLPVEAIPIFSRVLQYEQEPKELANTYYLLGKTLYLSGSYQDAATNIYKAIETNPVLYLNYPDVIRVLGDALFGMKRYSLARWALTWYLNLDSSAPKKDMLWAQIAETFFQENKLRLAERLQNKIILEMPDTEGAYVTLLRRAQILEEKSKGALFEAEMIYQELAQKNLPIPLKEITYFRWALLKKKEGKLDEALKIINNFINTAAEKTPLDDFLRLRALIVKDIIKKKFQKKKYAELIKIYSMYGSELDLDKSLLKILTISFEHLKIYDKALECCETLIHKSEKIDSTWYYKAAVLSFALGDLARAKNYALKITNKKLELKKLSILGKIATEEKNCERVVNIFEKLFSAESPPDKDDALSYIKCLQKLKKYKKIANFLKEFLKNTNELTKLDRYELMTTLMQSLEKLGQTQEAIRIAEQVIKLAPDEDTKCQTLYMTARLYNKQKNQKEVESCLQRMLSCKDGFWSKLARQELNFLKFKQEVSKNK